MISKTQMKNAKKVFNCEQMKNDAKEKKEVCSIFFMSAPARVMENSVVLQCVILVEL